MKVAHHTEEKVSVTAATAVPGSSPCSVAGEEPGERKVSLLFLFPGESSPGKPREAGTARQGSPKSHPALALGLQKGSVFLFCGEAAPSAACEGASRSQGPPGDGDPGQPQ